MIIFLLFKVFRTAVDLLGYGISKTIEISSDKSYETFNDSFRCTLQMLRRFDAVRRISVQMVIELYVLDHTRPPR